MTDLASVVREVVAAHERGRPRSQQRTLGPSGVGHPCARNLAYQLLGYARVHDGGDRWAAYSGTAVHAALSEAFSRANDTLGHVRWLTDMPVTAWPYHGGQGSLDLYDADTATVVDFKYLGTTSLREQRAAPKREYRTQVHVYGMGVEETLRLPVRTVALVLLPRAGSMSSDFLAGMHVWSEPYQRAIALDAKARVDRLVSTLSTLDEHGVRNGAALAAVQATPDPQRCAWCPWWSPGSTDLDNGCPGSPIPARVDSLTDLIASAGTQENRRTA